MAKLLSVNNAIFSWIMWFPKTSRLGSGPDWHLSWTTDQLCWDVFSLSKLQLVFRMGEPDLAGWLGPRNSVRGAGQHVLGLQECTLNTRVPDSLQPLTSEITVISEKNPLPWVWRRISSALGGNTRGAMLFPTGTVLAVSKAAFHKLEWCLEGWVRKTVKNLLNLQLMNYSSINKVNSNSVCFGKRVTVQAVVGSEWQRGSVCRLLNTCTWLLTVSEFIIRNGLIILGLKPSTGNSYPCN